MRSIVLLIILSLAAVVTAQETKPFFLGIQPADVTKEPDYAANEFDVNLFPLLVQVPLGKRIDIRATALVNYHFADKNEWGEFGMYFLAPVFLKQKEEIKTRSSGFYIGPVLGLVRSIRSNENKITMAIEPGYMFPAKKRFTVGLGAQFGGTWFIPDQGNAHLDLHLGVKVQLGLWFGSKGGA